jgi:flagellar assembly protein FliH
LSSRFIPRDKLAAFAPWQMAALEGQSARRPAARAGNGIGMAAAGTDAADCDPQLKEAREQGFRQGLAVGYQQGYDAGEAKAARQGERFRQIMHGFEAGVAALDETVARDLVQLALEVARQVVRHHVEVREDVLVPVLREALNSIAAIAEQPRLIMHPEDADVVKRELGEELADHRCRISPDASMAKGGVRIEDTRFELDASVATRWQRAVATIGLADGWLD